MHRDGTKLCEEDKIDLIITIQTPEAIPVSAQAERYGIPCVAIQTG